MISETRPLIPGFELSSSPEGDPIGLPRSTDLSRPLEEAALRRDYFRCGACGFASVHGLIAKSRTTPAHGVDDYETLCRFCAQVEQMEMAIEARSAKLCWLPEITQIEINRGMPSFLIAEMSFRSKKDPDNKALRKLLDERCKTAIEKIGVEEDASLKDILSKAAETEASRKGFLEFFKIGLRLLPNDSWVVRNGDLESNIMHKFLAHWRVEARKSRGRTSDAFQQSSSAWLERLGGAQTAQQA